MLSRGGRGMGPSLTASATPWPRLLSRPSRLCKLGPPRGRSEPIPLPPLRGDNGGKNFSLCALGGEEEEAGELEVGGFGGGDLERGEGAAGYEGLEEDVLCRFEA